MAFAVEDMKTGWSLYTDTQECIEGVIDLSVHSRNDACC